MYHAYWILIRRFQRAHSYNARWFSVVVITNCTNVGKRGDDRFVCKLFVYAHTHPSVCVLFRQMNNSFCKHAHRVPAQTKGALHESAFLCCFVLTCCRRCRRCRLLRIVNAHWGTESRTCRPSKVRRVHFTSYIHTHTRALANLCVLVC